MSEPTHTVYTFYGISVGCLSHDNWFQLSGAIFGVIQNRKISGIAFEMFLSTSDNYSLLLNPKTPIGGVRLDLCLKTPGYLSLDISSSCHACVP